MPPDVERDRIARSWVDAQNENSGSRMRILPTKEQASPRVEESRKLRAELIEVVARQLLDVFKVCHGVAKVPAAA